MIKSFLSFLNEFEVEGEIQGSVYHYYLVNIFREGDSGDLLWTMNIVSKNSDKVYVESQYQKKITKGIVEIEEIDQDEAVDLYLDQDWYYDEKGNSNLNNLPLFDIMNGCPYEN